MEVKNSKPYFGTLVKYFDHKNDKKKERIEGYNILVNSLHTALTKNKLEVTAQVLIVVVVIVIVIVVIVIAATIKVVTVAPPGPLIPNKK